MMKPIYILSSAAISPQESFEEDGFLQEIKQVDDGKLFVVDADYRKYINPVAIRRMSRLIKMGISAGMHALQKANIEKPDAIITGTGLGSMTDMEHFLKDMINLKEEALNPTFFIQSTYNSVNGWLSLQTKSTGYNQTFVHRGLSLELSLLDAQLLLNETDAAQNVLVGSFDELTPDYFIVKGKCGYWKKDLPNSLQLIQHNTSIGSIAGEGASFFTVSNNATNALCSLRMVKAINTANAETIEAEITQVLTTQGMKQSDIDIVITGKNGDAQYEPFYDKALASFSDYTSIVAFKHLVGEYPTATGFALWLATQFFAHNTIQQPLLIRNGTSTSFRNILIVNHYFLGSASVILLTAEQ